ALATAAPALLSPLFPYTTLFRSARPPAWGGPRAPACSRRPRRRAAPRGGGRRPPAVVARPAAALARGPRRAGPVAGVPRPPPLADRKSTRLNSSHVASSYAVFRL